MTSSFLAVDAPVPSEAKQYLFDKVFKSKNSAKRYLWPGSDEYVDRMTFLMRALRVAGYRERRRRRAFFLPDFPDVPDFDLDAGNWSLNYLQDPLIAFLYNNMIVLTEQAQRRERQRKQMERKHRITVLALAEVRRRRAALAAQGRTSPRASPRPSPRASPRPSPRASPRASPPALPAPVLSPTYSWASSPSSHASSSPYSVTVMSPMSE